MIFEGSTYTYLDIAQQVSVISEQLLKRGIEKGDNVGIILPNCPEFIVFLLVAAHIGVTLVPQNTTLSCKSIKKAFLSTGVKHIVIWHSLVQEFKECGDMFSLWLSVGGSQAKTLSYNQIIENKSRISLNGSRVSAEQPYILTMTSGSTGTPKPILLLQKTKIARVLSTVTTYSLSESDVILAATPLYHSLAERLVLLPLLIGGTSVLMAGFTPKEWLKTVDNCHVTFTMTVSSQLKQIIHQLNKNEDIATSLKCLVSSSELLDFNLKNKILARLHCNFYECYGTSELACVTNISGKVIGKELSVGSPLPGVEIEILKKDQTLAKKGDTGEIICKTPLAFAGYYKQPEVTANSMWNEYFCTGDLGRIDEDGFLYFQGRKKDIIVTGGINVYPKDIENVINTHPKVIESSVIPLPDERLGEIVVAVIATNDGALPLNELQRLCARELGDFQQPKKIMLTDKLPRNAMGKIMKRELVEMYSNFIDKSDV
ncbi:MAG: long-chain fatty acid--CoA ligase [Candidatus Electrothrix sp. AR1]|nr:long-chain fatty acid--CoA ligase [Candidatus Electrothrix sp. AR1]